MNNSQDKPDRKPTFIGLPRSRMGWGSIGLAVLFFVLFGAWMLYVSATPIARPTFFSDPLHAWLILAASAAGVSGTIAGVLALVANRERSYMILLSILPGLLVLYIAIAKIINPHP